MVSNPKGSRQWRITRAIHLHFTTSKSKEEIGDELGVSRRQVDNYLKEPPAQEVEEFLAEKQAEVREAAAEDYQEDLQVVGEQARTAEKPVKQWTDEDGNLEVREVYNDEGELVDRVPVPATVEMGPDTTERYFRREEKRELWREMRTLVGADAPEKSEIEHSGEVDGFNFTINASDDDNNND